MARRTFQPPRQHAALGVLRRAGRVIVGMAAAVVLLVLLVGVPYGLARGVGWPLPHHVPTWAQTRATLTGPFTDRILLDTLACLCWLVWAVFVADTLRVVPDAVHDARRRGMRPASLTSGHRSGRRAGPLRGLAAVLLAAVVSGLLSLRPHPAFLAGPGISAAAASHPTVVAASVGANTVDTAATRPAVARTALLGVRTVTVQPPRDGIHDSLWRIAARCLGDGARWPEIYRLNQGLPQPDGGTLTRPSLIQPGWVLQLPATAATDGSGSSPNHAPPSSTRSRTPPTRTPSTAPTTTPTTTPPDTPAASPTPSSPAASYPATPPRSADRPAVHATGRGGGVDLGDGAFVGLGLAGAISTALLVTRRRRRRFYVPGSGRRDDLLPAAPVVRTLHLAHLRATAEPHPAEADGDADTNVDSEAEVDVEADRADSHPPLDCAGSVDCAVKIADSRLPASRGREVRGTASGNEASPTVPAGVVDGLEVALDFAGLSGVGLVGPGAAGAARALIVHLLAATVSGRTPQEGPVLLVPTGTVAALQLPDPSRCPARLRVVSDLAGALDTAETEMLRHARLAAASTDSTSGAAGGLGLVLVTSVPAVTRRLQAIVDSGRSAGVGAILLGQWRAGTSLYVDVDGTVTATSPGPGEPLRGARLYCLSAADSAELLGQLRAAEPVEHSEPTAPLGTDATVDQPGADHAGPLAEQQPRPGVREASDGISSPERSMPSEQARTRVDGIAVPTAPVAGPTPATPAPDRPTQRGHHGARAGLALSVLGPIRLTWTPPDSPARPAPVAADITGALSARLRELLVLLAVHPDGITRDRLADTLWPDTSAGRPFATLNKNLVRLRQSIASATDGHVPEIVFASGDRHQLDPQVIATDFRVFSDALAARRAASSDEQRAAAYRAVVGTYRGELGEGLAAEWLETSREAVRRDAVDAATSLARMLAGTDVRAALDMLETGRAFDPYNEAIYRDIMRLQRRLGQPDAIERTVALLTTRLAELDETPGPETLALAQRLQATPTQTTPPESAQSAPARSGRSTR